MSQIKKIVIESYPVGDLPLEWRTRLESQNPVRVTIEQDAEKTDELRPLHEMYGFAKGLYASEGLDPAEYIRALRDEWD